MLASRGVADAKLYRVDRAMTSDDKMRPSFAKVIGVLKPGEIITVPQLYSRLDGKTSSVGTKTTRMENLRRAVRYAVEQGIVTDVTNSTDKPYAMFSRIPAVARWLDMLNPANIRHKMANSGGTRRAYGYGLYRLNNWLAGTKWSMTTRVADGVDGLYRDERRDVVVRDVAHLLELAMEKGGLDRDLTAILRQFFSYMNSQKRASRTVIEQTQSAIKSFFLSNDISYGLQLPRYMLRGAPRGGDDGGVEEWENRDLKMSEFARMLTVGKMSIRDKALFLAKFHRGLDTSTLADRFNYTAFDQIAAHMGTDDPASWDLGKCPVPIVLTRVKTNFKHLGFLERDAMAANIEWIAERERLTGTALRRGDGSALYLNHDGGAVTSGWIGKQFHMIAIRVGLCRKIKGGGLASTRRSHQLRHLLKSTLIDAGCRIDVADHVIGHAPKDTYEKQAVLYPDSLRREYAKAASKINIFSNFEASIDGGDDIHRLRAEVEADRRKLKEVLAEAEAGGMGGPAGGGGISGPVAEMLANLQHSVSRLQDERDEARAAAAVATGCEYQCIPCSLVHSSATCPACGSAERRVYGGGGRG